MEDWATTPWDYNTSVLTQERVFFPEEVVKNERPYFDVLEDLLRVFRFSVVTCLYLLCFVKFVVFMLVRIISTHHGTLSTLSHFSLSRLRVKPPEELFTSFERWAPGSVDSYSYIRWGYRRKIKCWQCSIQILQCNIHNLHAAKDMSTMSQHDAAVFACSFSSNPCER